jgi:hypothetical protein
MLLAALLIPSPVNADNCYERCSSALGGDSAVDEAIYEGCLNQCRNSEGPPAPVWFAALAVSEADMKAGTSHGQPSQAAAEQAALAICRRNGGKNCQTVNSGHGLCFGLAMSAHHTGYAQAYEPERAQAAAKALALCRRSGVQDCWIPAVPCSNDDARWPSPLPLPPPVSTAVQVDPRTVGTWQFLVNPGYWYWEVGPHGTYTAYGRAMDGAPSHAGTFTAADGHWSIQATNGYHDEGAYTFQSPDVWIVTGKFGTGTWRRATR